MRRGAVAEHGPRAVLGALALIVLVAGGASLSELRSASRAAPDAPLEDETERARRDEEVRALHAELERERAAFAAERAELRRRIQELEGELVRLAEDQLARERQWLDFTRVIASLSAERLAPDELARILGGPRPAPPESAGPAPAATPGEPGSAEDGRTTRERELELALRSLLVIESVEGLALLECGRLLPGAIGPVVFRLTDARGRAVGSLYAERLRLEASRSGRTTTIVLEEGFERRGGERVPFTRAASGPERRIVLSGVDPAPWVEAMPELFRESDGAFVLDDGRWTTLLVQAGLNELLRRDAAEGHWRLRALGGVMDGVLRDVELEELERTGEVRRRLFADRLALSLLEQGALLSLEDGVQVRGGRRIAFLDGRYRIFLPEADHSDWRAMGLPGIVPPKDSPLARGSTRPLPPALLPEAGRRTLR